MAETRRRMASTMQRCLQPCLELSIKVLAHFIYVLGLVVGMKRAETSLQGRDEESILVTSSYRVMWHAHGQAMSTAMLRK
jgi:hypothetical protein